MLFSRLIPSWARMWIANQIYKPTCATNYRQHTEKCSTARSTTLLLWWLMDNATNMFQKVQLLRWSWTVPISSFLSHPLQFYYRLASSWSVFADKESLPSNCKKVFSTVLYTSLQPPSDCQQPLATSCQPVTSGCQRATNRFDALGIQPIRWSNFEQLECWQKSERSRN